MLGYTAAALLEAHVKAGVTAGQLDECVELLLPTLEGDLFGEVRGVWEGEEGRGEVEEGKGEGGGEGSRGRRRGGRRTVEGEGGF